MSRPVVGGFLLAGLTRRTRADGSETFRISYRKDGKLCWSGTLDNAEDAARIKEMIERIGPDAALAVLDVRSATGRREPSRSGRATRW